MQLHKFLGYALKSQAAHIYTYIANRDIRKLADFI